MDPSRCKMSEVRCKKKTAWDWIPERSLFTDYFAQNVEKERTIWEVQKMLVQFITKKRSPCGLPLLLFSIRRAYSAHDMHQQ